MLAQVKEHQTQSSADAALEALIKSAVQGNREALSALCESIAKNALYMATCFLGEREGAEDIAQAALLSVCQNIHKLREPKAFRKWLSTIILHEKDRYLTERAKRGVVVDIEDYLEQLLESRDEFVPIASLESEELRKVVKDIICNLPERQREAVILRYYEDLNITESSKAMGVSAQCVSQYLVLAGKKIKRGLEEYLATDSSDSKMMGAAMPLGAVLTGVLQQEAALFGLANQATIQSLTAACSEFILAEAASTAATATTTAATTATTATTAATASGISYLAIACSGIIMTAAVGAGVYFNREPAIATPEPPSIVFHGGTDHGQGIAHQNPERVEVESAPEMQARHWWVTARGGDEVLLTGEGGTVDGLASQLSGMGLTGEFIIHFSLESQSHTPHKASLNFYIQADAAGNPG